MSASLNATLAFIRRLIRGLGTVRSVWRRVVIVRA
jgi:hypothetical protein